MPKDPDRETELILDAPRLVDYGNAPEIYCDSVVRVETSGPNVVLHAARTRHPIDAGGGAPENVLAVSVVMPTSSIPSLVTQLVESVGPQLLSKILLGAFGRPV